MRWLSILTTVKIIVLQVFTFFRRLKILFRYQLRLASYPKKSHHTYKREPLAYMLGKRLNPALKGLLFIDLHGI
jgi:hypothetical protein